MSYKKIEEGKWVVDFRDSMKRKHRIIVRGNKATAKMKEARLREQAETEIMFPEKKQQNVTFRKLSDNYFKLHGKQLRSPSWANMNKHIMKRFGNYTMKDLTSEVLQTFYNELIESGLKSATANRYITHINAIINLADRHGLFTGRNPCKAVDVLPEDNKRTRYLSQKEIQLLRDNCRADVWPVVFCALCTGMRRGEILNLEWQNVDLINDNITLLKTKTNKKREIPILPELKAMFIQLGPKPSGKVFSISQDAFICSWKRTLAKLKIPDFHFHDLRHCYSSYFVMNGGELQILQQLLGHSSLSLTQRYAHLSPYHIKKGAQVMRGVFGAFENDPKSK